MAKRKFLFKDGRQMAVIRPADPALALRLSWECVEADKLGRTPEESKAAFDAVLDAQQYTYAGLASSDGNHLLDPKGWTIGKMKPGDSFVPCDDLAAANPPKTSA